MDTLKIASTTGGGKLNLIGIIKAAFSPTVAGTFVGLVVLQVWFSEQENSSTFQACLQFIFSALLSVATERICLHLRKELFSETKKKFQNFF
jgi:hypothetical protein